MKRKMKQILSFLVFMAIVFKVFLSATYVFRIYNVSTNNVDRKNILGIREEAKDSIDMVYIGGSSAFVYWQPLKAWHDYGITSYLMATNSLQAEMIKYYIEEVQVTQTPDLYVIDARPFQSWTQPIYEYGIRKGSDSMDEFSLNRWKMLNAYMKNHSVPEDTDKLSYYLDLVKYHTNEDALPSPINWKFIDNKTVAPNKGFEWIDRYASLDTPADFHTETRAELLSGAIRVLDDLLEYCQSNHLQVLFVVSPYYIDIERQKQYNSIQDIIENRGFRFLNSHEYITEIGIDYSTDFYDRSHINCFGAEKYTAFLEEYIAKNYALPDHRGDSTYDDWNQDFERFFDEEEMHKAIIRDLQIQAGVVA